jgi:hypothetical protein
MRKLIALILIALFIPIPSASANGASYQFVTPVLTTTYELPAQSRESRWDDIEIPFSVILVSDGTVSTFSFRLIDAEGYRLSQPSLNLGWDSNSMYSPKTITQNATWKLYDFQKAKLPIRLETEIYFWSSAGKASIIQTFPMNFTIHKDDVAEKAKLDAVAKSQADAVAKAQAEAQRLLAEAKAISDAKAKAEADAKAKAEAEAKAILDAKAKVDAEAKAIADAKLKAEADAKALAEAELKAKQEAEAKAKADAEAKAKAEADKKAEYDKFLAEQKAKVEAETKAKYEAVTWTCRTDLNQYYSDTYNKTVPLMNGADADIFCKNLWAEVTKKELAQKEAEFKAMQAKRDLVNGTACKKLGSKKIAGGATFTCKKISKKLIWKM